MGFLFSIIPTLIVLGVLILIHELGHFIACRLLGVEVEKFSIGFGPEVFHWQGKKTRYAISLLPLGGFVKPAGESLSEMEGKAPKPGDYLAAPLFSRMIIVSAGVIMNYLLAIFLFTAVFNVGRPVPGTTIGGFVDGYPAKTSGLQVGDKIIAVNQQPAASWNELTGFFTESSTEVFQLTVERRTEGQPSTRLDVAVAPKIEEVKDVFGKTHNLKRIGITPHPEANVFEKYSFIESLKHAWQAVFDLATMSYQAIFYLLTGKLSLKTLAGPIGIVALTGSAAQLGLPYVLQLAATLSVSLAVINLLPVPALDGGHLFFLMIEGLRRKPVSLQVQERASQVGFILLMALMVCVIYNDLVNLDAYEKVIQFFRRGTS